MPPTDLAELRRLHEAAKKGKWVAMTAEYEAEDGIAWAQSDDCQRDADHAEYISAAHNAISGLLDELEALREEVRRQTLVIDQLPEEVAGLHAVIELQREMIAHKDASARRMKLLGAAEELKRSAKTLREDLADMNPPEFASRGKVAPGYCECLQDVADGMEERAAQLRREAGE